MIANLNTAAALLVVLGLIAAGALANNNDDDINDAVLDSETRALIHLFTQTIPDWTRGPPNKTQERHFFRQVYTGPYVKSTQADFLHCTDTSPNPSTQYKNFSRVLGRIDLALGRHDHDLGVYGRLFDLARGYFFDGPDLELTRWLCRAVQAPDQDIALLGARLAQCLPPSWAAGLYDARAADESNSVPFEGPSVLLAMVLSPYSPRMAEIVHELVETLPEWVRDQPSLHLRDLLHEIIWADIENNDTIMALINRMRPEDVDVVLKRESQVPLYEWLQYFTMHLVRGIQDGRLDMAKLTRIFARFDDCPKRSNQFYICATMQWNVDWIRDFLWEQTFNCRDVPDWICVELVSRWKRSIVVADDFLSTLSQPSDAAVQFRHYLLPEWLKYQKQQQWSGMTYSMREVTMFTWLFYMICNVELDIVTLIGREDPVSPSDRSAADALRTLYTALATDLLDACYPRLMVPIDLSPTYLLPYWLMRASRSDLENECDWRGRNLNCLACALIFLTLQTTHDTVADLLPMLKRVSNVTETLGDAAPFYGPVLGSAPDAIGIVDPNQVAVLALLHDPDLRHDADTRKLCQALDALAPDAVRTLTWFASEPSLYQSTMRVYLAQTIMALETANFCYSLMDCIVPKKQNRKRKKDDLPSCAVCLNSVFGSTKTVRLSCGHLFCLDCIQAWFVIKDSCPMCRQRHVHQLSRTRFIEMVDARMQLPADWMYWPSNWPRRRTEQ